MHIALFLRIFTHHKYISKMHRLLTLIPLLLLCITQLHAQVTWSEPKIEPSKGGEYTLSITARVEEGWHIYGTDNYDGAPRSTSLMLSLPSGVEIVGGVKTSTDATKYYDELFEKEIGYFKGEVTLSQRFKVTSTATQPIRATVEWMACGDGMCMPPAEESFEVVTPSPETGSNIWRLILEAVLWGFAALLTPCVFPMVPMTISYFIKGGAGRWTAALYGLFIVALYTIPIGAIILTTYILGGDAVMADIFNFLATHWLPNLIFFVVFMTFAASFLGAFDITLPSSWVNRSDSHAGRGSIVGIFFLSLTLVLVSFSCTGPIVGSVLISSTRGEFWMPILTIFAFSSAFALPFVVFAMFPTLLKTLPSSGGWLGSVKVVLGFLEIALGLKFLSVADQTYHWGILPREVYLAIWIVVFTLLGLYLLRVIRLSHDGEDRRIGVGRLSLAIITLSFVVYMLPGMWGAPLPALSGYLPPMEQTQKESTTQSAEVDEGNRYYNLEQAQAAALTAQKPLLVYFTGYGCVNCRAMEQRVWSNEEVKRILSHDYIIAALYMDDKRELPKSEWLTLPNGTTLKNVGRKNSYLAMQKYGVNAQPYYIIEVREGQELLPPRGYDLNTEEYISFLKRGIEAYSAEKSPTPEKTMLF